MSAALAGQAFFCRACLQHVLLEAYLSKSLHGQYVGSGLDAYQTGKLAVPSCKETHAEACAF